MPAHNLRFLVIEPELMTQEDIHDAIQKIGYGSTLGVSTIREGLMALAGGGLDFVICEWVDDLGPEMGFVKLVKQTATTRHIPVLVTSRSVPNSVERVKRATAAGADGWLVKPFDAERLKQSIDAIVGDSADVESD